MSFRYPCRIIAHRGGGTLAPENTLAAIRYGHGHGFGGVEFDVMLARENVPVLMHDDTLERTTSGRGALADKSAAELSALDAGSWRDARYAGEPVPSFEAAGRLCVELNLFANVEIKPYAPGGEAVARETGKLTALATQRLWTGAAQGPLLSSFSGIALEAAMRAAPEMPRAYLFDAIPADWHARVAALDCVAVHCNARKLDAQTAAAIKAAGYGLMCWTVNEPARGEELFAWGVDALCTDRLDLFTPR
ncbi:MAG TPA: glycerophosphodiester phosphodiesterase [Burkholderiales bacterium]|jgi:glycerophosphoryl diester phosphodiesterase